MNRELLHQHRNLVESGEHFRVKNTGAAALVEGDIVSVHDLEGLGVFEVKAALATSAVPARDGLLLCVTGPIPVGGTGTGVPRQLIPFNTAAAAGINTPVYLSSATAGRLTLTPPAFPVVVGTVVGTPAAAGYVLFRSPDGPSGAVSVTTAELVDLSVTTAKLAANAVSHAKLDVSVEQSTLVTLTNTEMLNLRAAPKSIIPTPGAGKANIFERAVQECLNGVAYSGPQNLALKYTDGVGAAVSTNLTGGGFVDQTTQQYRTLNPLGGVVTPNAALVLHNVGGAELGGGDAANVNRIRVYYRVVTL